MAIRTWEDVPGWFCKGDAGFVSDICRSISGGVVVEVGSFAGRSAAVMAPICHANGTELHCVDNWLLIPDPSRTRRVQLNDMLRRAMEPHRETNLRRAFRRNMKSLGVWHMISPHQYDSAEAAAIFPDGSVDFCFIDADHSYAGVLRDITAWWPKVRPGGTIGGHDWHMRSVRRAVRETFSPLGLAIDCDRRARRHTCWSARKPVNCPG